MRNLILKLFYPVRKRAIINTKSDKTFRGIIWKHNTRFVILKNAELLHSSKQATPVDGEVIVYKEDIDFIQVIG
jgi:hypothetical protein